MAFSEEVKRQAFIACGRCCCICHKFCGNNMEVHHIIPQSEGGEDTFENAIPLCFDCHAEVGSYNPRHPKGNKFSQKELLLHRDNWYNKVKAEKIDGEKQDSSQIIKERNADEDNLLLIRIKSGKELLSYIQNASAMEYDNDDPATYQEAEIIGNFVQLLNELLDECTDMEPVDSIKYGFALNEEIHKIENEGFVLFANRVNRIVKGGIYPPGKYSVFVARIIRKDNPNIYRFRTNGE